MSLRLSHERVSIPLKETFRTAVRSTDRVDAIRIELSDTNRPGVKGLGYATATPLITGDTLERIESHLNTNVAPLLAAADAGSGAPAFATLAAQLAELAPLSPAGTAGADLALYDLRLGFGGVAGIPISVSTSVTVSAGTAEEMAATTVSRIAAGFRTVKCKLGVDPENDGLRIVAVWRALTHADPNVRLWVDANQGWTVDQALRFVDTALAHDVVIDRLEQPTPAADIAALADVCQRVPMPVVADESAKTLADIDRIANAGAAEIINIKFMKSGGRLAAMRAVDRARRHSLGVLVGSMMEHPHSVAAAVQFAAILPEPVHDLDAGWWATDTSPLVYQRGTVRVESSARNGD